MKVITFLVDNWWLVFLLYGLYRAVTKKSAEMQRAVARQREQQLQSPPGIELVIDERRSSDGSDQSDPSDQTSISVDPYTLEEEPSSESTAIRGFQPAIDEETIRRDERQRLAAFVFVPEEQPAAARVREIVSPLGAMDQPSYRIPAIEFSAEDIRRAIIYSEIILPPLSRRPRR